MRALTIALLVGGLATGPAAAQVQQGNPNAANQSLSAAGQARAAQQGQTAQGNAAAMGAQRGQGATLPPPATGPGPTTVPRVGR